MIYARPNEAGAKVQFKAKYGNFINGEWAEPVKKQYFENISPVTGQPFCDIPRSTAEDIEMALDAAHHAKDKWGKTSPAERSLLLNKIADVMEQNLEMLAVAETWDNGKPVRETLAADIPLAIDHFRYCSSVTCSNQSTTLPSSFSWIAMCVIPIVGVAPCQCFSPGANHTTSPGRISSTEPPSR